MEFKSRSQAGQDRFAFEVLGRPERGTFLDIGANNPIDINNTYALEQVGWRGVLIDNSPESEAACRAKRISPFCLADATTVNWQDRFLDSLWATNESPSYKVPFAREWDPEKGHSVTIDYLSLDVDEATLDTLRRMPLDRLRFRAITVEHDAYRFGELRRDYMLDILVKHGYEVLCSDVCDQGMSFEIWAVDPQAVDMNIADKFRRAGPTDWKHIPHLSK